MTLKVMGVEQETFAKAPAGFGGHAEGNGSLAAGLHSHAEGASNATASYTHSEGSGTAASGQYGHAEGYNSLASGIYSHCEGYTGTASGSATHCEGYSSVASANFTHAGGRLARADGLGSWARASGALSSASRYQVAVYTLGATTSSLSAATLTFDHTGSPQYSGNNQNVLVVPMYGNYLFDLTLSTRLPSTATRSCGWAYKGMIARDTGNVRIVGAVTQVATWADGAALGAVAVTADTTNQCLQIAVTATTTSPVPWFGVLTVNEMVATS
jgi:hypothetical protein